MELPPAAKLVAQSKLRLFPESSTFLDPGLQMDFSVSSSSSAWASSSQKRKRSQAVFPIEIIDVDKYDGPEVVFIGESSSNSKNKDPMVVGKDLEMDIEDDLSNKFAGSSTNIHYDNVALGHLNIFNSSETDPMNFNFPFGFYDDNYGYDGYLGGFNTLLSDDYNFGWAAKYENLNLPLPGIEANVSTLHKRVPADQSRVQPKIESIDTIDLKFKAFKQFDTVQDHGDHHFAKPEYVKGIRAVSKPTKDWTKRIQHEWKLLEKDLPETIYVRVYEDRMDILRAVIAGPAGTPYHDGLFFFDAYFPPSYPHTPPMVHYHSGGLRLNPNLYACGKVCLSLLGTWTGSGCEKWNSLNSTMLQVLVSIQALVLNAKPYFNEPGYVRSMNTPHGEKKSLLYNEETFLLSCRTMLYSLRKPLKHFEDFVTAHFSKQGRAILVACKAYLDGAQVGCLVGGGVQDVDEGDKSCSPQFKSSLKLLFDQLLTEFTAKGVDCSEFSTQRETTDGFLNGFAGTTLKPL